jgi:hypothetical protein
MGPNGTLVSCQPISSARINRMLGFSVVLVSLGEQPARIRRSSKCGRLEKMFVVILLRETALVIYCYLAMNTF